MVDAGALADCFDGDELRGYSPIRNFTREERRVIAFALRQVRADASDDVRAENKRLLGDKAREALALPSTDRGTP